MDREGLMQLMGKIWNAYGIRLDQAFREAGLPLGSEQYRFLDLVRERPGQYQEIYARVLGKDRSTTTRMIQSLERKGWIQRLSEKDRGAAAKADTRIKRILLSGEGQAVLDHAAPLARQVLFPLWEKLAGEERESLELLLKRIYSNVL